MKVLNVEPVRYEPQLRALLASAGPVDYVEVADERALVEAVGRAPYDVLFTRLGLPIGRAVVSACPSLRWVITPTTGLDHLDLAALELAGARVVSLRGEVEFLKQVRSTAEHTWALLLALVRKLTSAHAHVVSGGWLREPFLASELHGKRLGVIGVGRLGRFVARYGDAFGMQVCGFDRDPRAFAACGEFVQPVECEELLQRSDVVTMHLPLDNATRNFLGRERLAAMKQGALLLNTARGELVDEHALLEALERGRLGGAALDVLQGDATWAGTVPPQHPLVQYAAHHSNLVLTPHTGGYGRESIAATRRFVVEKFLELSRGQATAISHGGPR